MNLVATINYHKSMALQLSRSRKSVAARAHAIRAAQLETVMKIRREVRDAQSRSNKAS
jgi:hypothetical protein